MNEPMEITIIGDDGRPLLTAAQKADVALCRLDAVANGIGQAMRASSDFENAFTAAWAHLRDAAPGILRAMRKAEREQTRQRAVQRWNRKRRRR